MKMDEQKQRPASRGGSTARLACALCLLLAACGFQPIYGTHDGASGPVADQLNQVAIAGIPDRAGQMLRNELIDLMYRKGRPAQPSYTLNVRLRFAEEDLGLLANATSTLTELSAYGDFNLKDAQGKTLLKGTAHSATSYDRLNNQYGTLAAHEDATRRTVDEIGQQIANRLSLYFAERPQPQPQPPQQPPQRP